MEHERIPIPRLCLMRKHLRYNRIDKVNTDALVCVCLCSENIPQRRTERKTRFNISVQPTQGFVERTKAYEFYFTIAKP